MRENLRMRHVGGSLLLAALLLSGSRLAACPACAGASDEKTKSVWPLVGAFLLVPPAVLGALAVLIRRETRTSPTGPGI
jgi:hypothetical protein